MRILSLIVLLTSLLTVNHVKANDLNTYQYLARLPETERSCQEEARQLANRFQHATNLEIANYNCRGIIDVVLDKAPRKLYNIIVSYKAPQEIHLFAASFNPYELTSSLSTRDFSYTSYATCLSDLSNQSQTFEKMTGLAAISAFCEPNFSGDGYVLRINGYGNPQKRLFYFEFKNSDQLETSFLTKIQELLIKQGAQITHQEFNGFFYYAKQPTSLSQTWLAILDNPTECSVQVPDVENMLKKAGLADYTVKCINKNELEILSNLTLLNSRKSSNPAFYYSFDECLADRDRVFEEQARYGHFIAGLCHPDLYFTNKRYVLELWFETL